MNNKAKVFDLNKDTSKFFEYVNKLKTNGKSDNLLFSV